jgi:O-antigen/teichoic acid export membrane protein
LKHFPDKQWIKSGVKIASPFLVSMIFAVFSVYIDRFYIASYIGLEGVGVYTFFAGFATALHTLTNTGVQLVYIPKMLTAKASGDIDEIKRQSFSLASATVVAIALLVITALFAIEPVLRFVEHEKYVSHIAIFYILTCSVIFRALADVPSAILYVFKKDKSILVANLGAFGAACVGNTLFVPLMGLAGAAVAATLTALVLFIITVVSCKRTFVISDSLL